MENNLLQIGDKIACYNYGEIHSIFEIKEVTKTLAIAEYVKLKRKIVCGYKAIIVPDKDNNLQVKLCVYKLADENDYQNLELRDTRNDFLDCLQIADNNIEKFSVQQMQEISNIIKEAYNGNPNN